MTRALAAGLGATRTEALHFPAFGGGSKHVYHIGRYRKRLRALRLRLQHLIVLRQSRTLSRRRLCMHQHRLSAGVRSFA